LAYDVVAAMMELFTAGKNSPELLVETLKRRDPTTFFAVGADLAGWRLGFDPVSSGVAAMPADARGIDYDTVRAICDRLYRAGLTEHAVRLSLGQRSMTEYRAIPPPSENANTQFSVLRLIVPSCIPVPVEPVHTCKRLSCGFGTVRQYRKQALSDGAPYAIMANWNVV
jgi:hypothetical protein